MVALAANGAVIEITFCCVLRLTGLERCDLSLAHAPNRHSVQQPVHRKTG
jgi:hypothetical protein